MKISSKFFNPQLTVIINFYNNRREAERTLFSLTPKYQNISKNYYRVIAIDNNSSEPLGKKYVSKFGSNFSYIYFKNDLPSPCKSINYAVRKSKTPYVVICIDGARILSPGILNNMFNGIKLSSNPFIYTIGMHIGEKPQKYLMEDGYNQNVEDEFFNTVDWENNGYKLFNISSIAPSSRNGFFSSISESNCFLIRKSEYLKMGGYDERFTTKGGGFANLDFFRKITEEQRFDKIMLLGEATFHQFHGGAVTNAHANERSALIDEMKEEYRLINETKKNILNQESTIYLGKLSPQYHSNLGVNFNK